MKGLYTDDVFRAAQLLGRVGFQEPPVDIEKLARTIGITEIRRVNLGRTSGALVKTTDKRIVLLNRSEGRTRQRFTLAHEVAHVVLGSEHSEGSWKRAPGAHALRSEERECDRLASEILMPLDSFLEVMVDGVPTIRDIEDTAATFDVSVQSTALKYARLSSAAFQIVVWEPHGKSLRKVWSAGRQRCLSRVNALSLDDWRSSAASAFRKRGHHVGHEPANENSVRMFDAESKAYKTNRGINVLSVVRAPRIRPTRQKGPRRP